MPQRRSGFRAGAIAFATAVLSCAPGSDPEMENGAGGAAAAMADGGMPAGASGGDAGARWDGASATDREDAARPPAMAQDGGTSAAGRDAGADAAALRDAGSGAADGGSTAAGGVSTPVKSAGCAAQAGLKSSTYTINVGGMQRSYILRIPDNYDANHPYRLILAFHWLNGTAQNVSSENFYGLWSLSNNTTIFAAPQGINNGWSDSGRSTTMGGQDINFTKALLSELTGKLCVDTTRIFAEGFSMGGSMSYAVACALPDVVRAVVAHSGGPMSGCVRHDKPVAYFMTHGTQDSVCTYPQYGVPQINDFAKVNGCAAQEMPVPAANTHPCVDFPGCMPGYPARACIFVGPHTPSPPGNWVPMETWKFISQF